jgi:hypothetical protein
MAGGASPQTAEIIKTFAERCPDLTVTNNRDRANYAVILDHEGGKGALTHHNKIAVFNRDGDAIFSHSTVSLGNSVKDACEAIRGDVQKNPQSLAIVATTPTAVLATPAPASPAPAPVAEDASGTLSVSSTPAGAEIQLDGSFVGSTPSTIDVAAGDHTIAMNKNGYKLWERKIKVTGGKISVAAELETKEVSEASKHTADTAVPLTPATPPAATPPAPPRDAGADSPETLVMIYLTSDPDGAEINVDDSSVGKAPMTLKLKPGKHAIRMFKNDYDNWIQWITIWAGANVRIKATLTKSNAI